VSERTKHLFRFTAAQIASAAKAEAVYHQERLAFWTKELNASTERVKATAGVSVKLVEITGGWRPDVVVDYGDPAAYQRMQEAARKIQQHDTAMVRFISDGELYATQGSRDYDLDADDVAHFRFNGRTREA
jgi:hypothetical protein